MKRAHVLSAGSLAIGIALVFVVTRAPIQAGQVSGGSAQIDADDIGGTVTGPNGPEAGVWVIAETSDLPTKFVKIVVTGEGGRYVIPDLPKANYHVWVRGYGLVDSPEGQDGKGSGCNP